MKYRKLRIAWSVAWGIIAVLLCVLWVWSYSQAFRLETGDMALRADLDYSLARIFICPPIEELDYEQYLTLEVRPPWYDDFEGYPFPKPSLLHFDFDTTGGLYVRTPIWLLAALAGSFALCPWVMHCHRFSLRTLLIVTTIVAILMGVIAWSIAQH
jgi:hypothetical protein